MTMRVNLTTLAVDATPLPAALHGLSPADLLDLSWVDPALGLSGYGWWPVVDVSAPLGESEFYGEAVHTADPQTKRVLLTHPVLPLPPEKLAEIAQAKAAAVQAAVLVAVQERLDAFARTRNYDSILSACTYAASQIPKFAAEGQAAVNARDQTWATLYTLLGEVQAELRPMPSSFADVEPLLPALEWPQ